MISPDVFIVADFRLFHSSVPIDLKHDHPKGQEIHLQLKRQIKAHKHQLLWKPLEQSQLFNSNFFINREQQKHI